MSTLALADMSPKMRQELGLDAPCKHAASGIRTPDAMVPTMVATIPVIETAGPVAPEPIPAGIPGAAWLRTGLHHLCAAGMPARACNPPAGQAL